MTEANPPSVAGWPSRIEDVFYPEWTVVVGGPAAETDPGKWRFGAYTEVTKMTLEVAQKLLERTAQQTSPLRRVDVLGEHDGYTRYRTRAGFLYLVRTDNGPPYLVAYFADHPPVGYTEDQVWTDLRRLADFATEV